MSNIIFEPTERGLEIIDRIEHRRYHLETESPVVAESVASSNIPYPVDNVAGITTRQIILPESSHVYVRDRDGSLLAEISHKENAQLPYGEYVLDMAGPIKSYASVKNAMNIRVGPDRTYISFAETSDVHIGARSHHTRPAGTITTTPEPTDVMRAVSAFGSALKTTTPERSYPTLRGHPPELELGDSLDVPDELEPPETDVRVEVPTTLRHTFVVAPLAYYLGAKVVQGPTPQIITESGYSCNLEEVRGFETTVSRLLKQVFLLDCIVRTEGEAPGPLYERQEIEPLLGFDVEKMYGQPLAAQLEAYLEVPFTTVRPLLPEWDFETRLEPTADHVEYLPYVANDLETIKINEQGREPGVGSESATSPVWQSWRNRNGIEITATRPLSSFRNDISKPPLDGPLAIKVICNDAEMADELVSVYSSYRHRDDLPFDVTIDHNLSTDGLEEALEEASDFVHYIGHIDTKGFRCADGRLDAKNIETVGTKAFFLNACQSSEQGQALIEAGAIGGIVTRSEIENSAAVDSGSMIARLLNCGLPLYAALGVLQQKDRVVPYHIVGDRRLSVNQTEQGLPIAGVINQGEDTIEITISSFTTLSGELGTIYTPHLESLDTYYLIPSGVNASQVSKSELIEFLNAGNFPVFFEGELRWSTDIKLHEL